MQLRCQTSQGTRTATRQAAKAALCLSQESTNNLTAQKYSTTILDPITSENSSIDGLVPVIGTLP